MNTIFNWNTTSQGAGFAGRSEERKRLQGNFQQGINTIILSPRRWGKSSLMYQTSLETSTPELEIIHLNVFACRTAEEFFKCWIMGILKQSTSLWPEWVGYIKSFLSTLNPRVHMGADPTKDFTISFHWDGEEDIQAEILNLPEKIAQSKRTRLVVCLDEFQQTFELPEANEFQSRLANTWKTHNRTTYCLAGSKKHMMDQLYNSSRAPFYSFGDVIYLDKLTKQEWIPYILERFKTTGKSITPDHAGYVCDLVENHPAYVQQLCWLIWEKTEKQTTLETIQSGMEELLQYHNYFFLRETESLTGYQINFLKAVACGVETEFSQKAIIDKYNLGSSANVARLKASLVQKEFIDIRERRVFLLDPVLKAWIKRIFV